jgi:CRISPR-associated protein Cst1
MKKTGFSIPFKPTGDPFVDAGAMALEYLHEQEPEKTVMELIEMAAKIYVKQWDGKINPLFLNSKITQPSYKGNTRITATLQLYQEMLKMADKGHSNCRLCGQTASLFSAGRDQLCLSGSAAFVNFHHGHETGVKICAQCSIKLFFLPLIVMQVGRMLAIIQAQHVLTKKHWLEITIATNMAKAGRVSSESILKYPIGNPHNALVNLATNAILANSKKYSDQIQLFHFTNFGAAPECDIYTLPNPIFKFLSDVIRIAKFQWFTFIRRHYHIRRASWSQSTEKWQNDENKEMTEDEYANNPNDVYDRLLSQQSILPLLRKYARSCCSHSQNFEILIPIRYAEEVLNMDKNQLALVKKIAGTVFDMGVQNGSLKKYLYLIESAGKAYQLRMALLKIIKDHYRNGGSEPVVTLDDYVTYLFPDGQFWGEVRDLLLIHLYEKMHQADLRLELADSQDVLETEDIQTEGI